MPRPDNLPLLPSVLDRLLDEEPTERLGDPAWARSRTPREVREGVRRDLEMLLNTVMVRTDLVEAQGELANSVLTFGLPDLTHWSLDDTAERERLCRLIRGVILRCEPRLRDVGVSVGQKTNRFDRSIHLQIEAVLHVDPLVETVAFDTMIDSSGGTFVVKAGR